jgi:hypothetical protein
MHINRENYEAWLLDMIEGELSPEQEEEVRQFLADNPDLEAGTDLLDTTLMPAEISFPLKEDIKKGAGSFEINKGNYEQFCIARIEGDLSASAEKALDDFLSDNPGCARTARLYGMVILKPDRTVNFPDKHMLKKCGTATRKLHGFFRRRVIYRSLSVAASVVLLLSASIYIRNYSRIDKTVTSHAERKVSPASETDRAPDAVTTPVNRIYREQTTQIDIESLISTPSMHEAFPVQAIVQEETINTGSGPVKRDHGLLTLPVTHLNKKFGIKTSLSGPQMDPVKMAGLYTPPAAAYQVERQLPAKLISGVMGLLSKTMDEDRERDRITLWDIADAGLKGINTVTGTDMRFEREYNWDGELVSMEFNSRLIEFRRSTTIFED